ARSRLVETLERLSRGWGCRPTFTQYGAALDHRPRDVSPLSRRSSHVAPPGLVGPRPSGAISSGAFLELEEILRTRPPLLLPFFLSSPPLSPPPLLLLFRQNGLHRAATRPARLSARA